MRILLQTVEDWSVNVNPRIQDPDVRYALVELANKVQAFRTFEHVDALLQRSLKTPVPALLRRAETFEAPTRVWLIEGIAHHVAAARLSICTTPPGDPVFRWNDVPATSLVPLHAGLGSALGVMALSRLQPGSSDTEIDHALTAFEEACVQHGEPGCIDVAREALGFATRSLDPGLLDLVAEHLRCRQNDLCGLFWHGAGRAAYFSPSYGLAAGRERQRLLEEAEATATEMERGNFVAGFAWAATLVNLGTPAAVAQWCNALRTSNDLPAFLYGVRSAVHVWRCCARMDPALDAFGFLPVEHDRRNSSQDVGAGREPGFVFQWRLGSPKVPQ